MVTLSISPEDKLRLLYQHGNPDMCLAAEEAIAQCGIATMRVWTTSKCVVIGRFQDAEKEVDMTFCVKNQIPVLRRFTGGGAVFLDEGVACLSFCLPLQKNPLDIFRALSLCVGETVGAQIDESNSLFIEKKKISGAASCKKWESLFHHMTLLVDCNLENMIALTPSHEGKPASTPHEVTNIGRDMKAILFQIAQRFQNQFGFSLKSGKFTEKELNLTEWLLREKYRKRSWNLTGIDPF